MPQRKVSPAPELIPIGTKEKGDVSIYKGLPNSYTQEEQIETWESDYPSDSSDLESFDGIWSENE